MNRTFQHHFKDNLDHTTASMAKYWLTEKSHLNISKCLQLFGGWGYMWEYPIARYYADSRAGKLSPKKLSDILTIHFLGMIYGGANEVMKELIARPIMS